MGGPNTGTPDDGVIICRSTVTVRRSQSIRSTVRPSSSPCRSPDPAANLTAARVLASGMASAIACTWATSSGCTRRRATLGSFTPAAGVEEITRSATAALSTAVTARSVVSTVLGASVALRRFTRACRSPGRSEAMGRSPGQFASAPRFWVEAGISLSDAIERCVGPVRVAWWWEAEESELIG